MKTVRAIMSLFGLDAYHRTLSLRHPAGSSKRPIGRLELFFEDIRARGFSPRGFVDVGANRDNWTLEARRFFPEAKSIMIEPLDEMECGLRRVATELRDCVYIKAGAGAARAELLQTITDDLAGSTFLSAANPKWDASERRRKAEIVTLDEVLAERSDFEPDLIKLDIQGYEL